MKQKLLVILSWGWLGLAGYGQETRLPSAEEVKALQAQFRAEREYVVKHGIDKRFLPELLTKADAIAKGADAAFAAGRMLQATEAYRQARWQLPYQSPQVPKEHVARILGNLRLRHSSDVNAVAFSPDDRLLASGSRDRTVKIWDLANGHERLTYTKHTSMLRTLEFSPDGKMIASAGSEADIRLWDADTGKDIRILEGKGVYVTSLAFAPDGKYLVTGQASRAGSKNLVGVYEVATGKLIREVEDFRLLVENISFSPDGSIVAVSTGDGEVRLWQYPLMVENLNQPAYWTHQGRTGAAYHVAFSEDGRTLARCGADGLKLYNLPRPNTPFQITQPRHTIVAPGQDERFLCCAFAKDSKTLFVGATDGVIRLYDPETGQAAGTYKGHTEEVRSLSFNRAGNLLASASADFTVRLWEFNIVLQARDFAGHTAPVWKSALSPDGQRIVSASADRTVKIWDVASGQVVHTLSGHGSPVSVALFSPDGKVAASAGGDKLIHLWNATTGEPVLTLAGHRGTISCLDFAPDGSRLVSGSVDGTVRVWNVPAEKEIVSYAAGSIVAAVSMSADGKRVAAGCVDQTIHLLDAATGKSEAVWAGHAASVSGLDFSPDGKYLLSGGFDQLVRLWPLETPGRNPITLTGHTGPLSAVAFRSDSRHFLSAGADQLVRLWKIDDGGVKEAQAYRGHREWVTSVAFSKDGHYFVSSGVEPVVKIWEITSRDLPLLAEHTGAVYALAVSPDGQLIASGASDQAIKLWDRKTGIIRATLGGSVGTVTSLTFTPDGKTLISGAADRNIRLWDVAEGKMKPLAPQQQQSWTSFLRPIPLMAVAPEGDRLIVWEPANDRYIKINVYELGSGKELFSFPDNRNVVAVSIAAGGKVVATAGKNGAVRLFDLDKNGQMFPGGDWVLYDKEGPGDVAVSRDASLLVIGSESGQLKFCRAAKREVLHTVKAHEGFVAACQISPDGKRAATLGQDGLIKLWDTATAKELRRWDLTGSSEGAPGLVLNLLFTPDGRHIVTANANSTLFVLDVP